MTHLEYEGGERKEGVYSKGRVKHSEVNGL